jgi:two-component system, NarL family, nitrate/nitrite response regulator NarL
VDLRARSLKEVHPRFQLFPWKFLLLTFPHEVSYCCDSCCRGASLGIRLVIAADVCFYRDGLAQALNKLDGLEVVAAVGTTDDALKIGGLTAFDVALVDMAMPASMAAIQGIRQTATHAHVVALGIGKEADHVIACAEAGAIGYVSRETSLKDLIRTIEAAGRGETLCSPKVAATLSERVAALAAARVVVPHTAHRLTVRERQIAELLKRGLSNKEIAHRLYIEVPTVKNHVHNILDKLGVRRRSEVSARVSDTIGDLSSPINLPDQASGVPLG